MSTLQELLDAILGASVYERYERTAEQRWMGMSGEKPSLEELQAADLLVKVRRGDFWYLRRGDLSGLRSKPWRKVLADKIPGYEQC